MTTWVLLGAAIVAEVTATVSLKLTEGFTRWGPATLVVVGYLVSFVLLSKVLSRGVPLSVVYAIWSAVGIAFLAIVDTVWFEERLNTIQILGLLAVVAGVAALQTGTHPA